MEYKRNRAGMFLQLSALKEGQRSFVIFPTGWNGGGWKKKFNALSEIINPLNRGPGGVRAESSSQGIVGLNATLPPPPLGSCPKCGFSGEPACFLRTFGQVVSSESSTLTTLTVTKDPSSSKGKQLSRGRREGSNMFFRPTPSYGGTRVFYGRKGEVEGGQKRSGKEGENSDCTPHVLLVISSNSLNSEAEHFP